MLFNSYIFWPFLLAVLGIHALFRQHYRRQNLVLLVSSYVFYGAWDWRFLSLILLSTVVDFVVARSIQRSDQQRRRGMLLAISIVTNLGILFTFKYLGFFVESFANLLAVLGLPSFEGALHLVLPVGISFYTFQTLSYTIDVYRRRVEATDRFFDFALFVSFFPQLVAGPIERASRLLPQILAPRVRNSSDLTEGLYLVLLGLFKKVVIADNMASIVNTIFATDPSSLSGLEVLVGIYAFAFQIYGDFSGYSSIARGVARWLGFDLMVNFRMPYFAVTPSDFWRRWHISLSTWLRDYLYISLGGNRGGDVLTYRNLMLTMLLGGLWHGAAWTFVAWGFLHGLILIAYRPFEKRRDPESGGSRSGRWSLPGRLLAMLVMFHLVCLGWLMFRADSMTQVWLMLQQLLLDPTATPFAVGALGLLAFYVAPLLVYEFWLERRQDLVALLKMPWWIRSLVYAYAALMLLFFPAQTQHEFIYFQF